MKLTPRVDFIEMFCTVSHFALYAVLLRSFFEVRKHCVERKMTLGMQNVFMRLTPGLIVVGVPYGGSISEFNTVEANMRRRRKEVQVQYSECLKSR